MRIAIVLNTSWNIYNFRMGLINALQSLGHEVIAIAPKDEFSAKLTDSGCDFVPVRMDSRGINPIKDAALLWELITIYKKVKPDVILHYTIKPNIYGTIASRMLGIPSINNVCGLGTAFIQKNMLSRIAQMLYRLAFVNSNKVFFQNEEDRRFFEQKRIVKGRQCETLPGSGIDPDVFAPMKKKGSTFTFLLVSRLIHDKGVLEYVEAVKKLKAQDLGARFQILGPIDEQHRRGISADIIQSWIDDGVVEYLGKTDNVKPFLQEADCVVLPSYREGTPRTLIEAASMEKPLVASNVAGCTNIVKDNHNGFLCNVMDSQDLAEKMRRVYSLGSDEREKMGNNGRKLVKTSFDEQIVIDKYLNAISLMAS